MVGHKTCRKLRLSPLFTRMEPIAVFGQSMGYERPVYYHRPMPAQGEEHVFEEEELVDEEAAFTAASHKMEQGSAARGPVDPVAMDSGFTCTQLKDCQPTIPVTLSVR